MTRESPPSGLYPEPAIYDILNAPGTRAEVEAFVRIERRHARGPMPAKRLWFEPACGTGRYLKLAARRGYRVAGFDRDARMLAYARGHKGLERANLFQAEMTAFLETAQQKGVAAGSVDLALNPVNTIRHLESDLETIAHLNQMAGLLKPRGLYVVGISLLDYRWLEPEEDLWEAARGRCRVSQLVNYLPPEPGTRRQRTETVLSHLTITTPNRTMHLDHRYRLRTYDQEQWLGVLDRSNLRRIAGCDSRGHDLAGRTLPYQLEILGVDPRTLSASQS